MGTKEELGLGLIIGKRKNGTNKNEKPTIGLKEEGERIKFGQIAQI